MNWASELGNKEKIQVHIFLLTKAIFEKPLVVSANIKHNWKYLPEINIGWLMKKENKIDNHIKNKKNSWILIINFAFKKKQER